VPRVALSSRRKVASPDPAIATEIKATSGGRHDQRFRRSSRLNDKSSFGRVFTRAQRSRDKLFTVLYSPNGRTEPRLGLAISRKHCRHATGRNRLKRIVRESFRQNKHTLGGIDIVVLNQPAATLAANRALFDSLGNHWRRCRSTSAEEAGKD